MNAKDQIRAAQRGILEGLMNWERIIGHLYDQYALLFPAMSAFWSGLAKQERGHAALLKQLEPLLDEGDVLWNIGTFRESALREEIDRIKAAIARAMDKTTTPSEAVSTAIGIESSLSESKFYSVVRADLPAFNRVADALSRAIDAHLTELRTVAMKRDPGGAQPAGS
ncbi:MAG: hypothetical protein JXR37_29760 [Kiritimatiellae bacterium]|nr:hypothetical protein [Kiritimatiellia bacterium]